MPATAPHVVSVNVGQPRELEWDGRVMATAIWKSPVLGRHRVAGINIASDDQADRTVHGGEDKAVYAYAAEDYAWWETELEVGLAPATFGENLTVAGLNLQDALIGERWRVGTVLLQVTQPRIPCFKLGIRMDDRQFPRRFAEAGRPGAYLSIVEAGEIGAGDLIEVVYRPDHGLTVGTVERAYHADRSFAPRLVAVQELPRTWRMWAAKVVAAVTHLS